jgi:hypothetical protein
MRSHGFKHETIVGSRVTKQSQNKLTSATPIHHGQKKFEIIPQTANGKQKYASYEMEDDESETKKKKE